MSIPSANRTSRLLALHDRRERGDDRRQRRAPPDSGGAPADRRAGPGCAQGRQSSSPRPSTTSRGPSGPKPNDGVVGPKSATIGVRTAVARCSAAESFVTSACACSMMAAATRGPTSPAALRTLPGAAAAISCARDRVGGTADHHHRQLERGGERGIVRPAPRAPHRARAPTPQSRRTPRDPPATRRRPRGRRRRARGTPSGAARPPVIPASAASLRRLVAVQRTGHPLGVEPGRRAPRETGALGDPRGDGERGGAPRAVGQERARVAALPERAGQTGHPGPAAVGAALVVGDHGAHRRVAFQHRRRPRLRHHVHRAVPLGEHREQRRGEHHVAEVRRLHDQRPLAGPAADHSTWSTARNASCGISTAPICFMRFFPSFCFSRSLRLRVMSPP